MNKNIQQTDLNHIRTQMNQTLLDDPETFSRHSQGWVGDVASLTSTKLTNKKKTAKRNSFNSVSIWLSIFDHLMKCDGGDVAKNISFQPKRSE